MLKCPKYFEEPRNLTPCRIPVRIGDGSTIYSTGIGNISVKATDGRLMHIPKCLLIPQLHSNLISIPHLDKGGFSTTFNNGTCYFEKGKSTHLTGNLIDNLYQLDLQPLSLQSAFTMIDLSIMHNRLGHYPIRKLKALGLAVTGLDQPLDGEMFPCEACIEGKGTRSSFPSSDNRATAPLELLHIDLAGPLQTESIGGGKYFLIVGFRSEPQSQPPINRAIVMWEKRSRP